MRISVDFTKDRGSQIPHHFLNLIEFEWLLAEIGIHLLARRLQTHSRIELSLYNDFKIVVIYN